jgi:hypothetical protein
VAKEVGERRKESDEHGIQQCASCHRYHEQECDVMVMMVMMMVMMVMMERL